jgi:hypothetical protein
MSPPQALEYVWQGYPICDQRTPSNVESRADVPLMEEKTEEILRLMGAWPIPAFCFRLSAFGCYLCVSFHTVIRDAPEV